MGNHLAGVAYCAVHCSQRRFWMTYGILYLVMHPLSAVGWALSANTTTQHALGGVLVVLAGIADAAAPAGPVVSGWANVHAVPEMAAVVTYVDLLAVQGAGN